jgi:hypothetical protein
MVILKDVTQTNFHSHEAFGTGSKSKISIDYSFMKLRNWLVGITMLMITTAFVWTATGDSAPRTGRAGRTEEYAMITYWTNQGKKYNFMYLRMPDKSAEKISIGDETWQWVMLDKINSMGESGWEVVTMDSQAFSSSPHNPVEPDDAHIVVLLRRKVSQ